MRAALSALGIVLLSALGWPSVAHEARAAGATISGVVWEDENNDGRQSSADTPARGAVVDLERRIDGQIAWFVTVFADSQGRFAFTDVPPGDYVVIAYWTGGQFISPPNRPQVPGASAEIALKVDAASDRAPLVFLTQFGFGYPGPSEGRSPRFPEGTRSVADQTIPVIPSELGLRHRIVVGPDVREVRLVPQKAPSETHPLRFDRFLCAQAPVVDGVADITPHFTFACPPGSRILLTLFYTDPARVPSVATSDPAIEWRPPRPGEGVRTVRAVVAPPSVGEAGLKSR